MKFAARCSLLAASSSLLAAICLLFSTSSLLFAQPPLVSLYVSGRHLMTPCGDTVVLRGVNKMSVWTNDLTVRRDAFAEIKKTGANCTRIVWLVEPGQFEVDAGPDGLDRAIQACIDADMIPMPELHDATGDWSKLQMTVDYWKRADVVAVVKKHEKYLLVNIANEVGNETVTNQQFIDGYTSAITQLRQAGIHTPLVIDASDWGKNLEQLVTCGPTLIQADPDHNLLFSVHTYWAVSDGADQAFIAYQFQMAVNSNLPFIVGEFTHLFNRGQTCDYVTDYASIISECQSKGIGWLAWEWGPGNEYADPTCAVMNMTTDSYYNTLQNTWASVVAISSPNSIKQTSVTPEYILRGGECAPVDVEEQNIASSNGVKVYPNPAHTSSQVSIEFSLTEPSLVQADVFDVTGRCIQHITTTTMDAGSHKLTFTPTQTGIVYVVLKSNKSIFTSLHLTI